MPEMLLEYKKFVDGFSKFESLEKGIYVRDSFFYLFPKLILCEIL